MLLSQASSAFTDSIDSAFLPQKRNLLIPLGLSESCGTTRDGHHEPTIETEAIEVSMLKDASVAIVDAHFPDRAQHAFGHGSQEHAAALARRFPKTLILAGHHGPTASDAAIRRAHRQHGKSAQNFAIAAEGMRLRWNVRRGLSVARS